MAVDVADWGVYGNRAAFERLQRAVVQGPRHAYLLSGPDFVGKSHLATAFAAALMCPEAPDPGVYCGACSTCRRIFKGVHPDVSRFDLEYQASQDEGKTKNLTLNISTVRAIGRHVSLRPVEARWRVVVVDDVETMQETAQEAFLKTLEEPPSYVVILMLCTDAELLLPTILSRCAVVPMVPATEGVVKDALMERGASEADAGRIAVATRGRVGLALRALEDDALLEGLSEHVEAAVSWVISDEYARMVEAIRLADRFSGEREHVFDRLMAVQAAWRDLVLAATEVARGAVHPVVTAGRLGSLDDGVRAIVVTDRCIRDLEANVRPRAALATMVQEWPEVEPAT
ncbi:MAG TPA: hypothetical protein VD789_06430 [Thermomicrobiales bacterium]|nr:hypothetical protein [Thermomicrobiales bacterium]